MRSNDKDMQCVSSDSYLSGTLLSYVYDRTKIHFSLLKLHVQNKDTYTGVIHVDLLIIRPRWRSEDI